jgi:hypothetical protein
MDPHDSHALHIKTMCYQTFTLYYQQYGQIPSMRIFLTHVNRYVQMSSLDILEIFPGGLEQICKTLNIVYSDPHCLEMAFHLA